MKFLVTDIEFDFNTDLPDYYSVSYDDQTMIVNDNLGVWDAEDEDDLIEEITANAGWCIRSIDYEIQLKQMSSDDVPLLLVVHVSCFYVSTAL